MLENKREMMKNGVSLVCDFFPAFLRDSSEGAEQTLPNRKMYLSPVDHLKYPVEKHRHNKKKFLYDEWIPLVMTLVCRWWSLYSLLTFISIKKAYKAVDSTSLYLLN